MGDCILWIGAKSGLYGQISVGGKLKRAHRVAWEKENGSIPEGLYVLHHCDNPPCVNVDHLFLGTQADNMRDMSEKGRNGMQRHPERSSLYKVRTVRYGPDHHRFKLTDETILVIRQLARDGISTREIGRRFKIDRGHAARIASGKEPRRAIDAALGKQS